MAAADLQIESQSSSKPLKEKTTKAERRALQESQRAAKAAAKGLTNQLSSILDVMKQAFLSYNSIN